MSPSPRKWATKVRNQYNKHYREREVLETALDAAENILENFRNIPDTTMVYVDKESYNSFFSRDIYNIVLLKISILYTGSFYIRF